MAALNRLRSAWDALFQLKLRGTWRPGAHNIVLLIVQVVLIWSAAQRGMDYFQSPPDRVLAGAQVQSALIGIEADISLTTLGLAFLIPAGVAFVGLAMGWAKPLSLGHMVTGASYLVLGITFLREAPVNGWVMAYSGAVLLLVASALLVTDSPKIPDVLALLAGVVFLVAGALVTADGLGSGYRTGNDFIGQAVIHFVIGFGTQVLARRADRLRRGEEEDLAEHGGV